MKRILNTILLVAFFVLGLYVLYTNLINGKLPDNPPLSLAHSFVSGRLDIPGFNFIDKVTFNEKIYWHEGPFPSLILVPFALINLPINFGVIVFLINILIFLVLNKLTRLILKCSPIEALWWVFLYFFGSVFIGIAFEGIIWYFYHLITTLLICLALLEYYGKRRYFIIGVLISFAIATRLFSILGLLFFLIPIFFSNEYIKEKVKKILNLGIPILFVLVILGWYNYSRFGNIFETGYSLNYQHLDSARLSRETGLFNIENIPTNVFWYFFKGPDGLTTEGTNYRLVFPFLLPNPWGMSIFLTMPFFLLAFLRKPKSHQEWGSWATILVMFFFLLSYYTPGFRQYGTRLINDLLSYWFILLLLGRKGKILSNFEKIVILVLVCLNIYLFSIYKWEPTKEIWQYFQNKQLWPQGVLK
jgi:hypothetical protein